MKKSRLLFICISIVGIISSTYAQDKKHEIEIGLGIWNINEIINTFSDIIISSLPSDIKMRDGNSWGSIHAAYKYRLSERIGIGGLFAYDHAYEKAFRNGQRVGKFYKNHYTLAVEADYIYLRDDKFCMYALGGLGGTLYSLKYKSYNDSDLNDSDSNPYFTFQITPFGFKYGKNWGGFLEIGFGYRGIANAGLFMRL